MKRKFTLITGVAIVLAMASCRKEASVETTVEPPAQTSTTATASETVPASQVTVANAPVPVDGLQLWLRADYGVTKDATGAVTAWASEGSPIATGPIPRKTPPVAVDGVLNGKSVIRFDGEKNILQSDLNIDPSVLPELTVIAVFNSATAETRPLRKLYGADDGGYDRAAGLDARAKNKMNYVAFGGTAGVIGNFELTPSTWYVTVDHFAPTAFSSWVNAAPAAQNVAMESRKSLQKFYVGGTGTSYNEPWKGDLAEMLVYARALTDEERARIEDYLAAKYGLTLNRAAAPATASATQAAGSTGS